MEQTKEEEKFVPVLTEHDKASLKRELDLIALKIPCCNISKLGKSLKPHSFHRKGIKPFQTDSDPKLKCLLLNKSLDAIPKHLMQLIKECGAKAINYKLILDYDKLSALEILQSINKHISWPTHFETIGHIVHFNLRQELLKYKYLIGQIYLDKLPNSVKTVVNKTKSISNEFRVFPMEIIGGIDKFETSVKENGCLFSFNFNDVYWNSRLGTEHQKMCDLFEHNQIICDMMAGVGPFTIPAAKNKNCTVYANDLNPKSFAYLQTNCKINNVENNVYCYNMDGRTFWKKISQNKLQIAQKNENRFIHHIIMNLPAIAIDFLDVFANCYDLHEIQQYGLPMVHCYCFAPDVNAEQSISERLDKCLGMIPHFTLRLVRNVAPHKEMYCVSFRLPQEIALCSAAIKRKQNFMTNAIEPPQKKSKLVLELQSESK